LYDSAFIVGFRVDVNCVCRNRSLHPVAHSCGILELNGNKWFRSLTKPGKTVMQQNMQ